MKSLLEIAKLVESKRMRKMEFFYPGNLTDKSSKFNRFYQGISEGKFKNDRDAASYLYNSSPSDDRYRQLKSRFRKRLLNTLFLINPESSNSGDYDRAFYTCNKDWALVQILFANGALLSAEQLARQILNLALKFKFSDVIVNCSRVLREYASKQGNQTAFDALDEQVRTYSQILAAELESESILQRVLILRTSPGEAHPSFLADLIQYCNKIVALSEQFDSPIIFYTMYRTWAIRYEVENDYQSVVVVCNHANEYISEKPGFFQSNKILDFQLLKMKALLNLRLFRPGQEAAEQSLPNFKEGSERWFHFMKLYFLLAMHTQNYVQGLAIYQMVSNSARFGRQPAERRDRWKLFAAYLFYILSRKQFKSLENHAALKSFKLDTFLNDNLDSSKDKHLCKLHLLLLQSLIAIHYRNFETATERIQVLHELGVRTLRKKEQLRFLNFIRMLDQFQKANFILSETRNHDRYLAVIKSTPLVYLNHVSISEVIPFEDIWAGKFYG